MANICDTEYRLTSSPRKALADLWSTLQEMEVNKHDVNLYHLAERYGIDYEKKKIVCTKSFVPSGDVEKEMREIKLYYKDFKGRKPELFTIGDISE